MKDKMLPSGAGRERWFATTHIGSDNCRRVIFLVNLVVVHRYHYTAARAERRMPRVSQQ